MSVRPIDNEVLALKIKNEIYGAQFSELNQDILAGGVRAGVPSSEVPDSSAGYKLGRWVGRMLGRR